MQRALVGLVALCLVGLVLVVSKPTDASAPSAPSAPLAERTGSTASGSPAASAIDPSAPLDELPTSFVDGLDVSDHQKAIDWVRVAGAGRTFAWIRATAGTRTVDRTSARNVQAARAAGLIVGAYHFANPSATPGDAEAEAAWFLDHASIRSGDLVPALDLERANGLDPDALRAWTQTWLETVTSATGVHPIVYTSPVFWWGSMADTDWFAQNGYELWIAHWTAGAPIPPALAWDGRGWTVWQHTNRGSVAGIHGRVDLDRIAGTTIPERLLVP